MNYLGINELAEIPHVVLGGDNMELNKEQQQKIKEYLTKFMSSVAFREEIASREKRREFIGALLSREKLRSMTELEFGELISKLWAQHYGGINSIWYKK